MVFHGSACISYFFEYIKHIKGTFKSIKKIDPKVPFLFLLYKQLMTALQNLFLLNTLINLQLLYTCRIHDIHADFRMIAVQKNSGTHRASSLVKKAFQCTVIQNQIHIKYAILRHYIRETFRVFLTGCIAPLHAKLIFIICELYMLRLFCTDSNANHCVRCNTDLTLQTKCCIRTPLFMKYFFSGLLYRFQ